MLDSKVASRYAKSLIDLGLEKNALEDLMKDMSLVKDVCSENKELILLLKSPIIRSDKKATILKEVFYNVVLPHSKVASSLVLKHAEQRRK